MEQMSNQGENRSFAEGFGACDQNDDMILTLGMLKHCIAQLRENSAAPDGNVSYEDEKFFRRLREDLLPIIISTGGYPSRRSNLTTAIFTVSAEDTTVEETPLKQESADSVPKKEDMSEEYGVQKYHCPKLRKDVARTAVYRARGVRCKLCWVAFKDELCVKGLILHTKESHPDEATPEFLLKIRKDNSFKKMLGNGIMYCTCENCLHARLARWDKRYDKTRCKNFIGRL